MDSLFALPVALFVAVFPGGYRTCIRWRWATAGWDSVAVSVHFRYFIRDAPIYFLSLRLRARGERTPDLAFRQLFRVFYRRP